MSRAAKLTDFQAAAVRAVTTAVIALPPADRRLPKAVREARAWAEMKDLRPMLHTAVGVRWGIA